MGQRQPYEFYLYSVFPSTASVFSSARTSSLSLSPSRRLLHSLGILLQQLDTTKTSIKSASARHNSHQNSVRLLTHWRSDRPLPLSTMGNILLQMTIYGLLCLRSHNYFCYFHGIANKSSFRHTSKVSDEQVESSVYCERQNSIRDSIQISVLVVTKPTTYFSEFFLSNWRY